MACALVLSWPAMEPVFITFEGLDGSGKSSHLARVSEQLEGAGIRHLVTKEPGGTPLADAIRTVFLDSRWGSVEGVVELLLVFASRRQHLLEKVDRALQEGTVVLCDRFTDSTFAYQGFARGVPLDIIRAVDEIATESRRPDRTLIFDLPAHQARQRRQALAQRSPQSVTDRIDREPLDFYLKVREGFLELARLEPERFRIVDSSGAMNVTAAATRRALEDLFPRGTFHSAAPDPAGSSDQATP